MSKLPRIIGFTGVAGSGKNTAAAQLQTIHPHYQERAFADPIKEMLRRGLGLDNQQLNGNLKEEPLPLYNVSPRVMMQTLGTEWARSLHPDFWVISMQRRIEPDDHVVITDVRFENEARFVREHGVLIHVMGRGGIEGGHISEAGVAPTEDDLYLSNGGTPEDLLVRIHDLLYELEIRGG